MAVLSAHFSPETTGNAPYVGRLATGLVQRGLGVRVLTAHPHYPEWTIREGYGQWSRRDDRDGVVVLRHLHYVPRSPSNLKRLAAELSLGLRFAFSRWGKPDVILLVSPALFSSTVAMVKARLLHPRTPVGVWVQDIYSVGATETGGNSTVAAVIKRIEAWLFRSADGVSVIHDRFATVMTTSLGVEPSRVEVIRNWTHVGGTPAQDRASWRATLGWPEDATVVLHAGNMGVKQGLENVVDAARVADSSDRDVRFVLMGDGNQKATLVDYAKGVRSITFLESVSNEDFMNVLGAADVLLVNEKLGVAEMSVPSKLTSYFKVGRPVLAATADEGATATELRSSQAGEHVPAGDPRALLDAAIALGDDTVRSDTLGRNGQEFAARVLDETAAIDHHARWLSSLRRG
ncbi:glycosyltransferase WbuB [Labedella endophytica]|uniref:D-inositol 3-phosphate glycosyltransferase n=1 Tax=Labedella endophytica TaxID=1523160 RepID=A0A433JVE0_9MICO|nr:glycosyltransferase WbuB [Labedella endophytica]